MLNGIIGKAALTKLGQALGAGVAIEIGGAVAKETGIAKGIGEFVGAAGRVGRGVVEDILGVQKPAGAAPVAGALPAAENAAPAPASVAGLPPRTERRICTYCAPGINIAGTANQLVLFVPCEDHAKRIADQAAQIGGLYLGWGESMDRAYPTLGDAVTAACGKMPSQAQFTKPGQTTAFGTIPAQFDNLGYQQALVQWQSCKVAAIDKAAAVNAVKAEAKADKRVRTAQMAKDYVTDIRINAQQKKYQDQIDALNKQMTDANAAATQQKIAELQAQKDAAQLLADQIKAKADSDARAAELQAIKDQAFNASKQSGGLDEMIKMMLMKQIMTPPAAPVQQQPYAMPWGAPAQQLIQLPDGSPAVVAPQPVMTDPYAADPYAGYSDFGLMGANDPLPPEMAEAMGIAGVATVGEAREIEELRAGFSAEELSEFNALMAANEGEGLSGCSTGSCGLPRM